MGKVKSKYSTLGMGILLSLVLSIGLLFGQGKGQDYEKLKRKMKEMSKGKTKGKRKKRKKDQKRKVEQDSVEKGPRLSEPDFFKTLNLERSDLSAVKAAVTKSDWKAARAALVKHVKNRKSPIWWFSWKDKPGPDKRPRKPNTRVADRALKHILNGHQFGEKIDWHFDKTNGFNNEWTWGLNRHDEWQALSRAYWDTGDEKYARECVSQMLGWIETCPIPKKRWNVPRSAWRTIEAGIRMGWRRGDYAWPSIFMRLLASPEFTDEAVVKVLTSIYEHAKHLRVHPGGGNWLAIQMNGLFTVAVLFPEFKEAAEWQKFVVERVFKELNTQVYPDGAQFELTPHYHNVSLGRFERIFKLAQLNKVKLPAGYLKRLEKMYHYNLYSVMPDGTQPNFNDTPIRRFVSKSMKEAASLYPHRKDFLWYATKGKKGEAPKAASNEFPYAGQIFMRSSWKSDALALAFDCGPFGAGHQHEDKLNFILHAYGKTLVTEMGRFSYNKSVWRKHCVSAFGHNVVFVDGLGQKRGAPKKERRKMRYKYRYVVKKPLPHKFVTTKRFDFAEGYYDEGFGERKNKIVTHVRRILFVKPDYFVVADALIPSDNKSHRYEALFHLNASQAKAKGLRVVTAEQDGVRLFIIPLEDTGLMVRVVKGEKKPDAKNPQDVQGWTVTGGRMNKPRAIPTAIYQRKGTGVQHFFYVFYPVAKGQDCPVAKVVSNGRESTVHFTDGRRHEFRFDPPKGSAKEGKLIVKLLNAGGNQETEFKTSIDPRGLSHRR